MTLAQDIAKIQSEASLYGAGVQTRAHLEEDEIVIDLITVPPILRRQGIASQILGEYVDVADVWGKKLTLEASTDFNTPRLALHILYSEAGFVPQGKTHYIYYPANK